MLLDGLTHAISDLSGIGQGFRDTNAWLALLTQDTFPISFYAGDAIGSFTSLMRLVTGLVTGIAIVWLGLPYIFQSQAEPPQLSEKNYGKGFNKIKREDPSASR